MMRTHVKIMSFLLLFTLICSCRSTVSGILIQHGTASLRLYEEFSGRLIAVKPGIMSVEVIPWVNRSQQPKTPPAKTAPRTKPYLGVKNQDSSSAGLSASKNLHVCLKIRGKTFLLRFDKSKIDKDGRFSYSADTLEQPVRVRGQIHKKQSEFQVNFNLYRGFSRTDRLIGSFVSGPMDISLLDWDKSDQKEPQVVVAEKSPSETKDAGFIGPLPLKEKNKAKEKVVLLRREDAANETVEALKELPSEAKAINGTERVIGFIGPLLFEEKSRTKESHVLKSETADKKEGSISGESYTKNIKESASVGPLPLLKEKEKTKEKVVDLLKETNT